MRITITSKQREELNNILELLEYGYIVNNKLAFSLLESDYKFLYCYGLPNKILNIPYRDEYTCFSKIVHHKWTYQAKIFIKELLNNSDFFKYKYDN